jgi:hypothetical protein
MKLVIAGALVLCVVGVLFAHAGAQTIAYPDVPDGCVIVGINSPEDEGFPVAECAPGVVPFLPVPEGFDPGTGTLIIADMDGVDGSRGTDGDGVWKYAVEEMRYFPIDS